MIRTGHGTMDWFKIGKGVRQGWILSLCLFNLYADYIMWNAGLDESQARTKIAGRNINNLRYTDDTTLMAGGEGDDREWDGWMASPTRWTWVWVNSGSWWWTGRPGVLWLLVLQRVGHDWVTELNWTELAFSMIQQMLAIWSLVPLPFLSPAWTSRSSQFTYCWNLA